MKNIILLNSNEDVKKIEEEEKNRFVYNILSEIGLDLADTWDENGNLSIDGKKQLRKLLSTYQIEIVDYAGDELKIYCDGQVIGEWRPCKYILRRDLKQVNPTKKLYLEMHIDCSSIFEENQDI